MDSDDLITIAAIFLIGLGILAAISGAIYFGCMTWSGQQYDVTVTVQAVEHSTRYGEHTDVWVRVYGDQDITYKFVGTINLEVGKTYRIKFVDTVVNIMYILWEVRGIVQSIEIMNVTI